ncbi:MAG: hypothetical protein L0H96_09340 [Humibacillus sp.]|nr:hypothetical protein [Humibacillus sp.]MDN5777102.1 hypothetical protein [Humibacillus sp.]
MFPPVAASPTEPPATAIRLDYSGGKLARRECSDPSGSDACVYFNGAWDPLTARCTDAGCSIYVFDGVARPIDAPLSSSGDQPNLGKGCAPTHWTLKLTPVGKAVTEGITHPARLIGTVTASRPAESVPGNNCLGAEEAYRYDATPS